MGAAGWLLCQPAYAFDFFGLFGSDDPPPFSATALSYRLTIEAKTADGKADRNAEQALRDASATYRLRQEPPPDGEGLVRRLQADINPSLDALWGLGRYNAEIDVSIDGRAVTLDETGVAAAARQADGFRNRAVVPVKITARLGPLFKLRTVDIDYPHDNAPNGLPRRAFPLKPGDPAISADLRAAQLKLIDWFRSNGHPLAKVADVKATVDHAAAAMDFRLRVEAGPKAGIGHVAISGSGDIDPRVVATHVHLREGEPYSPERLALMKTSIAKIPAIGGIRIREGDTLDANGNVPIFVDVTERPKHAAGFSARYSTIDGPGVSAYYEHRNLFGNAERLRLEASASLLQRIDGSSYGNFKDLRFSDFGARFTATFIKPGLYGTPNDLLVEATAFRERVGNNDLGGYTNDAVRGTIGVIHRFSEMASVQAGLQVEQSQSQDVLGHVDATLIGFTAGGRYDTTDNLLDPTRGVRLAATFNAYPKLMGSSIDLYEARLAGSAYYALDEDANYVLAGRFALGSLGGGATGEHSGFTPLLLRWRRLGAWFRLQHDLADDVRPDHRRPQPGRGLRRGTDQGYADDWNRAVHRFRYRLQFVSAELQRLCRLRRGHRPALSHTGRPDSPRRRDPAESAPRRQPLGGLCQHRSGLLMRARRIILLTGAALGLAGIMTAGIVAYKMVGGTSDNQQDLLAGLVSRTLSTPATQVHIGAVDGALSSDATIRDVTIADRDGPWLKLDRARLVWRRTALLVGRLEIDRLEIGTLEIRRKPLPSDEPAAEPAQPSAGAGQPVTEPKPSVAQSKPSPTESGQPILPELPVKVQVKAFDLQALVLGQPVLGEAVNLAATGNTELGSPSEGLVFNLDATRKDFPGRFKAALSFVPQGNALTLDVTLDEPSHGLLSKLGRFPDEPSITFALRGKGTLDSFRGALKFQAGPDIDATGDITLDRNGTGRLLATRITGHLGPWLPPLAASIFAGETKLNSATRIGDDGSVTVDGFALTSRLARLDVKGALGPDRMMDFSATVRSLPSNGDITETDQGSIRNLVFDGRVNGPAKAPRVSAKLAVLDAHLPDGNLGALDTSVTAVSSTELSDSATTIAIDANLRASGIAPRDPALASAIGDRASLVLKGSTDLGGEAKIAQLEIGTPTVQANYTGEASFDRLRGRVTGALPDLARFGSLSGLKLAGAVRLNLDLDGDLQRNHFNAKLAGSGDHVATGLAALDGLAGPRIALAADVSSEGKNAYTVRGASLDGAHVSMRAKGNVTRNSSNLTARIELPNLAATDARLSGAAALDARLTGGFAHPGLSLTAAMDRATAMQRPIPHLGLTATIADIYGPCTIDVRLDGSIDGKPARGVIQANRMSVARAADGMTDANAHDQHTTAFAGWDAKTVDIAIGSVALTGGGTIDAQRLARGQLRFAAGSLVDIAPLALTDLAGAAMLDLALANEGGRLSAHLVGNGAGLRVAGSEIRHFDVRAEGDDLYNHPVLNADARISDAKIAGQTIAKATLSAKGNSDASTVSLSAKAAGFNLDADGVLTPKDRIRFDLNRFTAKRGARTIALQAPANFTFDDGTVSIRHLAIGIGSGRLTLDGKAGNELDLKAVASAIPLAEADVAVPGLGLGGTLDATAAIGGSASAPTGQYKVNVKRLTAPQTRGAGVPPIDIAVDGRIEKTRTKLDATASAGKAGSFTATGTLPLDATETIALTAKGRIDVAVANTMLSASGRTVSGTVQLDTRVSGTRVKPQVAGVATISGGSFRDSVLGTRLDAIEAKVIAEGERISVEHLNATTPNGGALSGSGQVRIAPDADFPGTVSIRGQQATLAASALATARANLAISVTGALARDPKITGRVDLTHVSVDIPERLPSTLKPIDGVNHVNATGQAATRLTMARKAEAARNKKNKGRQALFNAALDVTVSAPNHIFVHGHGVNAELGGSLHVGGTTNSPAPKGAFSLYRGKMAVLGKTLNFTKGSLSFNGNLAPEIDFAAEVQANDITAQIGISGPASAPAFAFTSRPELPQDEILSRIMFQKASGSLTTAQALQLAEVAAQFAGGGDGALDRMRRSLGVDSLDVGAGSGGGPMVGASRTIGDRLSVGVRTGATPSQSGLSANVDVTRHIRVESDVDAKGSTSVGVGTRFEW